MAYIVVRVPDASVGRARTAIHDLHKRANIHLADIVFYEDGHNWPYTSDTVAGAKIDYETLDSLFSGALSLAKKRAAERKKV